MKTVVRLFFRGYKVVISPILHWIAGPGAGCRFEPSCSEFFAEAVEVHGFGRGSWLGLKRICRCQPWGGQGYDPVPTPNSVERPSKAATPEPTQHSH